MHKSSQRIAMQFVICIANQGRGRKHGIWLGATRQQLKTAGTAAFTPSLQLGVDDGWVEVSVRGGCFSRCPKNAERQRSNQKSSESPCAWSLCKRRWSGMEEGDRAWSIHWPVRSRQNHSQDWVCTKRPRFSRSEWCRNAAAAERAIQRSSNLRRRKKPFC